ncbi:MAG: hypothetical protein ACOYXT_01880 [Bacteroidota bacterium]
MKIQKTISQYRSILKSTKPLTAKRHTGLGYVDVMQLKQSNVSVGIDAEYWVGDEPAKDKQSGKSSVVAESISDNREVRIIPGRLLRTQYGR